METSLEYKLMIKGKDAKIGSKLYWFGTDEEWHSGCINYFFVDSDGWEIVLTETSHKGGTVIIINEFDNIELFWEKPIIYQLPDTEGNLSEVKVGQKVWFWGKHSVSDGKIFSTNNGVIYIIDSNGTIWNIKNRFNYTHEETAILFVTNKPKRDFSPHFDWSQAPDGFDFGGVNRRGQARWYTKKPFTEEEYWWGGHGRSVSAGFRQNLINPKTGRVDDWQDSLVERPKEKVE